MIKRKSFSNKLLFLSCIAIISVNTSAFSKTFKLVLSKQVKNVDSRKANGYPHSANHKTKKDVGVWGKMPQQGGLPEFKTTENFQTIKGEAEGAGDSAIIEERGGMPEFDITGFLSACSIWANPGNTYHGGAGKDAIISDKADFVAETINLKSNAKTKMDEDGLGFVAGEAGINFAAKGTFSNGIEYSAKTSLQTVKGNIDVDKVFISFEHKKAGQILIGNLKGPDCVYDVGGQSLIGGCAGINGAILSNLDYATAAMTPRAMIGNSNKATKIAVYSKKFAGFQIGVGFTPDTKHHGHDIRNRGTGDSSNGNDVGLFRKGDDDKERPSGRNNFSFGIRFEKELAPEFTLKAAAVMVIESTKKLKTSVYDCEQITANEKDNTLAIAPISKEIELNNAKSFQLSLSMTYKNVTISGGFFNSGKSRLPKESAYKTSDGKHVIIPGFMCDKNGTAGRGWNVGARVDWKKLAIAGVYHHTWRNVTKDDKAVANIFTMTLDYLIRPSLKVFAEFDYVTSKSCNYACNLANINKKEKSAISKQSGTIVATGVTIQF